MENKKTKLTISGKPKKTFKRFDSSKTEGKKQYLLKKEVTKLLSKEILISHKIQDHYLVILKKHLL